MKKFMRPFIAAPLIAVLSIIGDVSVAAVTSTSDKASAVTALSTVGFLDFKTLLYSPSTGDNLAGVFNQIKFIGPEMFKNATLPPRVLRRFKRNQNPQLPTNPVWGWDERDLDVLDLNVNGKPLPASSGLVDAILTDMRDNIRNYGVSSMPGSGAGAGTAAHFNSATQKVIDQIINLENVVLTERALSLGSLAPRSAKKELHPEPVIFFGLGLVVIGLLRRRSDRNVPKIYRKASPLAYFHAIRNSPIRYTPKIS